MYRTDKKVGIEILRIISALMICVSHVNISLWLNVTVGSHLYNLICFVELASLYGVNIFGLITGYLNVRNEWSTIRIIRVWAECFFYSVFGLGVAKAVMPHVLNHEVIMQSIFPVAQNTYWYVTAYIGVMLISPIFNKFVHSLGVKSLKNCLMLLLLIASYSFFFNDLFAFGWGYNAVWLSWLYCVGAVIHELHTRGCMPTGIYDDSGKKYLPFCVMIWIVTVILNWLMAVVFYNSSYVTSRVQRYDNILIVIGSISLFVALMNVNLSSTKMKGIIAFASGGCLAVYLIQVHPVFWKVVISEKYLYLLNVGKTKYVLHVLFHSITSFLVFVVIDGIRRLSFKTLGLNDYFSWISRKIDKIIQGEI